MNPKRTFPAALRRSPNPLRSVLPILLALLAFSSAQAQTVYRWIADNVDFGEPESPWTNLASWDPATMVPGTQPLNANDVVELNGDGSNGFGTATKEITINAATGSLTVGTLRFGDRDTGSALIIEDSDGNPATAQAEGIIFDTSVTSDGASDGVVSALFHGLDNLEAQDTRGILSVGSDAVYGNSGDAFEVGVSLRDADGFLFDGFFNFRIDSPMVDLLAGSGGSDFTKRGQGILFFDENDDTQATNGSLTGVNNVFVEEGELRFDGDNTDPDGVVTMQIQGDLVVGAGEALLNSRAASNARYVLPVLRLYRNNTGATISSTYTGTSATSEVGGSIYLNSGSLYIANSSIGAGGGEATIEPDIIVSGAGNQLQLNRANNNSEAVVFTGVITGSGELHKDDNARGVFTADNTFSGVLGVGQQSDDNGGNLGGVELVGANGAFSAVSEVRLYNNGTLVLENSDTLTDVDGATMATIVGAVNNDRINDSATWILQDLSKLEIVGNQTVAVSETLGDIQVLSGRPSIEFDLNNGNTAGQINLTLASITRAAGSELRFRVEDAYDSALPFTGAETTVTLLDGGASLAPNIVGGGGAAGSTNMNVVRGVTMDISNNFGGRIATVDGNLLRVLDHNPASATFEFIDATGTQTGGASQLFDSNWNTTNGTDQNVMWYFSQNTPTMSTTVNGADFESGRVIMDDVTVNSVYLTGLSNTQMGGNNNLRRNLVLDDDATMTVSSGVIVVGRQTTSDDATAPGTDRVQNGTNDVFITGGTIDLGQEGFFKNRNGSAVHLNSDIVTGSGGLTWSAPNWTYFDGQMDLGGGDLNIVEGTIHFRFDGNVSNINQVNLETNAGLYIRDGVHLDGLTVVAAPNDNSALGATVTLLRTEGSAGATVSNTDFVMNCFDQLGETFGTMQISMQTNTVMNLDNVNIYSTDPSTRVSSDTLQADPQTFQFFGETSVLNFDGVISDVQIGTGENGTGVLAPINPNDLANTDSDAATPSVPITPNGYGLNGNVADPTNQENQFFRVRIDGGNLGADRFNPYNEVGDNFALNFERSGQQFNGALQVGNGILRFTDSTDDNDGVADGKISFFHDEVANSRDYRDFWTSFRLVDDITGNDNRAVVMMTQPGQVFNIGGGDSRVDTDSGEDNFAIIGYGAITGEATFGDEEYNIGGGFGKRLRVDRELMVYAAGDKDTQGTLNMRMSILDDNGRDGELTKIGRGVVNLRPNAIANEGASNFQFDDGLNMFGGDLVFDFDHGGSTGMQFTSNDTNGASTPDLRFQGGALRILGDTNQTRAWNNIDGNLIVNQGRGEFEYRAQGGNATITAGGTSTNVIRTAGGQLNFVVDTTNIGAGTFKATYQNATISAGSADDVFDSRMGGAFTVGDQADTAVNWAAFDSEWELGGMEDSFFNGGAGVGAGLAAFGAGIDTQIEDAAVSTGAATSTGSMRIDAASTVTFGAAAGSFVVEDGILIPTTNAGAVVFDGPMDLTGTVKTGSATTENELLIHNYGSGGLDLQNVIADNGAKTSLTIGGTGTTTLSGVNTHTGNTYINGGSTVVVDADSDFGVFDTTNGYGIHDVLLYRAGDNYETGAGTTFSLVDPLSGGTLSGSETAPTVTMELVNDQGIRNIRVTDPGSGYTAQPIAVFNDTVDASGANHGQGARAAVVLDGANVVLNGGALQVASSFELDQNRSIVLQGDGGTINVADGEVMTFQGYIVPERHTSRNNANGQTFADYFSGDLDINADGSTGIVRLGSKVADGQNNLIVEGGLNNLYMGQTNIYAGTVQLFGQPYETNDGDINSNSSQAYVSPFGTSASAEDGTVLHENTTLNILFNAGDASATAYDGSTQNGNNNLNDTVRIMEWFTMKDGAFIQEGTDLATEDNVNTGRNISLDGVITIEDDSNAFFQSHGGNEFLLSFYGGEVVGSETSRLIKLGDNNIRIGGPLDNFEGQLVVIDGVLEFNSHGNVDGVGTAPILVGGNLMDAAYTSLANPISLPGSARSNEGTGTVGLLIRDDGGLPGNTIEVDRDIKFVNDGDGVATGIDNSYRIGAWFLADTDVALYSGNLDFTDIAAGADNEQVQFYYRDDVTSRNYGSSVPAERAFIEFSGDIVGDANGRTVIEQAGTGNGTSQQDELDYHAYFVFSGDNSAWGSAADRVSMEIGLRSNNIDTDRTTYWRAGSDTAFNQYQDMFLKMGSRLQAGGNDVTIGNLVSDADNGGNNSSTIPLNGGVANDGAGTFYAFLENGSNTEGSVTITQTGDHVFTGLIRDGFDPLTSSASGELGGELQHGAETGTTEGASLNVVYNGEAEVNLTVSTPSTYTGTTIINSGILQAGLGGDGTWNAGATSGDVVGRLGTGDVTVAGGTLAGTGQVQNNLIVDSGFLTPGDESGGTDGVGTLFVGSDTAGTGNVTFNGGTTTFTLQSTPDYNTNISFEDPGYVYTDPNYTTTVTQGVILGTAPATLDPASFGAAGSEIGSSYYDHLEVANDLTWTGGTIKVEAAGYTPLAGDIFNLVDWFGTADWGSFNTGGDLLVGNGDDLGNLDLPDLSAYPELRWDTRFFMSDGIIFVVAPEPSRLLLLGMGLITLLRRRRARA